MVLKNRKKNSTRCQDRSDEIEEYRMQYRPEPGRIRLLLLGESPPHSGKDSIIHFFYNPDYTRYDYLYKALSSILFPAIQNKENGLNELKDMGFFLLDATDKAINKLDDIDRLKVLLSEVEDRITEISELITREVPIILIKHNVYDIYNDRLKRDGFNVLNSNRLPFPIGEKNEKTFDIDFKSYLLKVSAD